MNTVPLKTVYEREYQRTHFKKSVYPMFADMRFRDVLKDGATVQWDYDDDATADELDSNDGYTLNGKTVTSETLTVNQKPSHGFVIPGTQRIQDHRPTQEKWARKAMNVIHNKVDGDILKDLASEADSALDAEAFGGTAGDGIVPTSSNSAAIFAAAQRILTNKNVLYDENKVFANNVKLDGGDRFPVSAVPAELKEQLLLQTGFKDTGYADQVMKSGFMGPMFGFNSVVSTALPFSFRIVQTNTPTDAKTLTVGGVVVATWETGTIDAAGKVKAETDATTSITNLCNFLNDPYATISGKSQTFVRTSLTVAQKRILDNISAVDNEDGSCTIWVAGLGALSVSTTETGAAIDREIVHAIFGVSRSIGVVMQRAPELEISAGNLITTGQNTGYVGKQYLAWSLYGRKVFHTQKAGLVDVKISATNLATPSSVIN